MASGRTTDPGVSTVQAQIDKLVKQNAFLHSVTEVLLQITRRHEGLEQKAPLAAPKLHQDIIPATRTGGEDTSITVDAGGHTADGKLPYHRSRPHAGSGNTVGNGVHLGLVRAGDVLRLGDRMLKELDDGLREIARRLFPRDVPMGPNMYAETQRAMIALLQRVSLRQDTIPQSGENNFLLAKSEQRGRYQRAEDVRYGYINRIDEAARHNALYYETFLQLVLFREIDLEEV